MTLFCQFCRLNRFSSTYVIKNLQKQSYFHNINTWSASILNPRALSLTRICYNRNATELNLLLAKHYVGYCHQPKKLFSSNRDGSTPSIKGTVVTIPNPFAWVKNKVANIYIRNSVDPQFSMEDFKVGAIQAVNYFFRLIASNNTEELEKIATNTAVADAMKFINSLSPLQRSNIEFKSGDASYFSCDFHNLTPDDQGGNLVEITVFVAVVKPFDAGVHIIQGTLRFSRKYQGDSAGSWMITNVDIGVEEIQNDR